MRNYANYIMRIKNRMMIRKRTQQLPNIFHTNNKIIYYDFSFNSFSIIFCEFFKSLTSALLLISIKQFTQQFPT